MKTILVKCIFLFSLTGLLIGCNTESKRISENNIQFDSLFVEKTYHMFEVATNPGCSLQINFIFPVNYSNRDTLILMQQQFVSDFFGSDYASLPPNEAAERYADSFISAYKEVEDEFKIEQEHHDMEIEEMWYVHDETATNKILFNRNDLLSFVVHKSLYFGGAHGGQSITNRTLHIITGQRIMESEIFIDDYSDDLTKIIIDAIALSNNVEIDELENIGFFNLEEIHPNNNFYVDEIGITYTYNEYEIAATL